MYYILRQHFFKVILLVSIFLSAQPVTAQNEKKLILGTWVTGKGLIKFNFNPDMKCYRYYKGKLSGSYKYRISNSTTQCGEKVSINKDEQTSYLELTDLKN